MTGLNSTVLSPDLLTGNITVTGTGLVPESSTLMLLSLGVLGMLAAKYRHYRFKDVMLCCDNRALINNSGTALVPDILRAWSGKFY